MRYMTADEAAEAIRALNKRRIEQDRKALFERINAGIKESHSRRVQHLKELRDRRFDYEQEMRIWQETNGVFGDPATKPKPLSSRHLGPKLVTDPPLIERAAKPVKPAAKPKRRRKAKKAPAVAASAPAPVEVMEVKAAPAPAPEPAPVSDPTPAPMIAEATAEAPAKVSAPAPSLMFEEDDDLKVSCVSGHVDFYFSSSRKRRVVFVEPAKPWQKAYFRRNAYYVVVLRFDGKIYLKDFICRAREKVGKSTYITIVPAGFEHMSSGFSITVEVESLGGSEYVTFKTYKGVPWRLFAMNTAQRAILPSEATA